MENVMQLLMRPAVPDDAAYIASTWVASQHETSWWARVPAQVYRPCHRQHIVDILSRPGTRALVACSPEDSTLILGWVVYEPNSLTIHYVFTRRGERRKGVASAIWTALGLSEAWFTAWSHEGGCFAAAMKLPFRFLPYAAFTTTGGGHE